jgi:tetratricopeptide (TPR) repeat protein
MNAYVRVALALCSTSCAAVVAAQVPGQEVSARNPYRYDLGESRWIQKEKERAESALSKVRADVLVTPFQVDGDSFDAIERSLMARTVAAGLRERAGLAVADSTLVERALGSAARSIPEADILRLAKRVGAKTAVLGFVGHDNQGTYHVRVQAVAVGDASPAARRAVLALNDVPFGDTNPPYFSFRARRDEIVDAIGAVPDIDRRLEAVGETAATATVRVPSSIEELERLAQDDPVQSAYLLQFLGVLHPRNTHDRARDGLFERSLIVLEGAPGTPETRVLKARAWVYLNRRPLALQELGPISEDVAAMRAYADGDLDGLSTAVTKIRSPLAKILATLERERARADYGKPVSPGVLESLATEHPYWAPLFAQMLALIDPWGEHSNATVKLALDAYWPLQKYDLAGVMRAAMALAKAPSDYEIAQLAYRHLDEADALAANSQDPRPGAADVVELLRQMVVANVVADMRRLDRLVGQPEASLTIATTYEPLLADHPDVVMGRGWAEFGASRDRTEPEKSNLQAIGYEHLRQGAMWSQGQTVGSEAVLAFSGQFFPGSERLAPAEAARQFFDSDWPNLPGWGWRTADEKEMSRRLQQCVDYTIQGFQCFLELHASLVRTHPEAATALLAANERRFIGHPGRIDFLAREQRDSGNEAAAADILGSAIAAGTTDWEPYRRTGVELAKNGKSREALQAFLKYPGFKDPSAADRVALANQAYEVGSLLYWAGAYDDARPLYEFAAALNTGSDASITSSSRLALLDRDFEAALGETARRARRYGSSYALRDLMMFVSALGDRDTGWAVFNSMETELDEPDFWIGAFAIQRMEGASLETIANWSFEGARASPRTNLDSLAMRHVFLTQITDREITDAVAAVLRERDPGQPVIRDIRGTVHWNGEVLEGSRYFGDPPLAVSTVDSAGERVDSRLTTVALAMAALQRKDYQRAFAIFDEASRIYELQEFLPYYAWASAHVGKTERIEGYLARALEIKQQSLRLAHSSSGPYFDEFLSLAFLTGFKGDVDEALRFLVKSNADVLHTEQRAMFTRYEIVEVAELLYEHTHERRYRDFMVDLARRNSLIDPAFSWPYAFVGKYSDDAGERALALARALYLDPLSRRALASDPKELRDARRLIDAGNPLLVASADL